MRSAINPFNAPGQMYVPIDGDPEFQPARHTKKSYAAQNREAKRRKKANLHNNK